MAATEGEFSRGLYALNTIAENGLATPSHGGTVTAGHEYDMTIHPTEEKPANAATANLLDSTDNSPAPAETTPTASPSKRGVPRAINPAAIAARRPVSMPP